MACEVQSPASNPAGADLRSSIRCCHFSGNSKTCRTGLRAAIEGVVEESGGRDDLKPPTMTVVQKYVPTPRTSNSTRERFAHEPKHLHEPQRKCRTLQNFAQQIWWQNFDHGELKFVTASMPGTAIGFRRIYIESSIYKSYTEPFG